ncbi:MAG: hypothetical protein JXR76_32400 [Deltaproteobacteria bacterium]|nr:hypothetical protein [Deltaproteobacteria bacterium]
MQILFVSTRYTPENKPADEAFFRKLAGQFVKSGHDVRMIVAGNFQFERVQTPMAQRLSPVAANVDGTTYEYTRFDTKTTSGVHLHVLKSRNEIPEAYSPTAMGSAADALVRNADFTPEMAIVFNGEASFAGDIAKCPRKIAAFTSDILVPGNASPHSGTTQAQSDRIIVHGTVLAAQIMQTAPSTQIAKAIATGVAEIMPACGDAPGASLEVKSSTKASLQNTLGLPVRSDVPFFYLNLPMAQFMDALPKMLTQNVQVVCKCQSDAIEELLETYPDRLCALPPDAKDDSIVNGVDFRIQRHHPDAIATTLLSGTVPIVAARENTSILELSNDAQSGTGLLYTGGHINEAVTKALGIYSNPSQFVQLRKRIAHSVATLEYVAEQYLNAATDDL